MLTCTQVKRGAACVPGSPRQTSPAAPLRWSLPMMTQSEAFLSGSLLQEAGGRRRSPHQLQQLWPAAGTGLLTATSASSVLIPRGSGFCSDLSVLPTPKVQWSRCDVGLIQSDRLSFFFHSSCVCSNTSIFSLGEISKGHIQNKLFFLFLKLQWNIVAANVLLGCFIVIRYDNKTCMYACM